MAYEMKENSGSLFKNDKRETDSHPNATGKALIGGVEYWVSAWTKEGAKGKWQSLSFKPAVQAAAPAPKKSAKATDFYDDDIPPF